MTWYLGLDSRAYLLIISYANATRTVPCYTYPYHKLTVAYRGTKKKKKNPTVSETSFLRSIVCLKTGALGQATLAKMARGLPAYHAVAW